MSFQLSNNPNTGIPLIEGYWKNSIFKVKASNIHFEPLPTPNIVTLNFIPEFPKDKLYGKLIEQLVFQCYMVILFYLMDKLVIKIIVLVPPDGI
jgi:hypothetical protein